MEGSGLNIESHVQKRCGRRQPLVEMARVLAKIVAESETGQLYANSVRRIALGNRHRVTDDQFRAAVGLAVSYGWVRQIDSGLILGKGSVQADP
jgi:signal transduction protein with GAF and PtsI domain